MVSTEDRRVEKTKKIIDDACWELMQEKNFDDITVRDIALRAKINRATFYRYHADKYDWMEKKIREMVQELTFISSALHTPQDAEALAISFEAVFDHFDAHFSSYSNLMTNKGTAIFQDLFKKLLLDMTYKVHNIETGRAPQTDLRFHLAVSAAVGAIEWWVKNDRPLNAQQMAKAMCSIHGIST